MKRCRADSRRNLRCRGWGKDGSPLRHIGSLQTYFAETGVYQHDTSREQGLERQG
jgi:hypothetical protein